MADYQFPDDDRSWPENRNPSMPAPEMRRRGDLTDEPGAVPDARIPENEDTGYSPSDAPFHQYLLAVGAMGKKPVDLPKQLHDMGMQFAHAAGLEPILAVGYVSEAAHPADYLSAAKVWHNHLSGAEVMVLRERMPKLYTALSLLFGVRS